MNEERESKPWKWIAFAVGAAAVATILWLLSWALITSQFGNPDDPGPFGDMFGAVNALFSGLAFAGIIVAILMQQEELKIQRKELTQSRYAQEGQVKALLIAAQLDANIALLNEDNIQTMNDLFAEDNQNQYDPAFQEEWKRERVNAINELRLELHKLTKLATDKPTSS